MFIIFHSPNQSLSNWSFTLLNAAVLSHWFAPISHSQNPPHLSPYIHLCNREYIVSIPSTYIESTELFHRHRLVLCALGSPPADVLQPFPQSSDGKYFSNRNELGSGRLKKAGNSQCLLVAMHL